MTIIKILNEEIDIGEIEVASKYDVQIQDQVVRLENLKSKTLTPAVKVQMGRIASQIKLLVRTKLEAWLEKNL